MDYQKAREYLRKASERGSVLGLDNIRQLLLQLSNPQESLTFIHITGTNGKGSVLSFISSVLSAAGYRVGSYISPAVLGYRERIQIDGKWIEREELASVIDKCREAIESMEENGDLKPTVFEIETSAALLYFKEKKCDFVVMEAGMGGELDATNIIRNTDVAVFTSVSRDHTGFLGSTVEEIALNKAGIIKPGCTVVTGPQTPEVMKILKTSAAAKKCSVFTADTKDIQVAAESYEGQSLRMGNGWQEKGMPKELHIGLAGSHQVENAAIACQAILVLKEKGYSIDKKHILKGFAEAKWVGRFTCILKEPVFIIDGAHNVAAALRLKESAKRYFKGKRLIFIMGVFKDKEYKKIAEIMAPLAQKIYAVELPDKERTLTAEELKRVLDIHCNQVISEADAEKAAKKALAEAGPLDVILAFGSLSYLGQIADVISCHSREL